MSRITEQNKNRIARYTGRRLKRRYLRYIVVSLAAIIIFTTTYALILPAITFDSDTAAKEPGFILEEETQEEVPTTILSEDETESENPLSDLDNPETDPEGIQTETGVDQDHLSDTDEMAGIETDSPVAFAGDIEAPETDVEIPETEVAEVDIEITETETEAVETDTEIIEDETEEASDTEAEIVETGDEVEETTADVVETDTTETAVDETEEKIIAQETETDSPVQPAYLSGTIVFEQENDYTVTAVAGADAEIPADADFVVSEITDKDLYALYYQKTLEALGQEELGFARFFDIRFEREGIEIEPKAAVEISVRYAEPVEVSEDQLAAIHFHEEETAEEEGDAKPTPETIDELEQTLTANILETSVDAVAENCEISFTAETFSVFGIVGTTIETTVLASDGHNYHISATYGPEAGVPENSELLVDEILQEQEITDGATAYETYLEKTREALGLESGLFRYARFFDIRIVDENGKKVEIAAPVEVKIELADAEGGLREAQVVHFADGSETGEVVSNVFVEGETVNFTAEGFSAYAIVEGPAAIPLGWTKVSSLENLQSYSGLYIGHTDGYYLTGGITQINSSRTGITKTKPAQSSPAGTAAVKYWFEACEGTNQYKAYCIEGESKKYVIQTADSLNFTTNTDEATTFTVETGASTGVFRLKGSDGYYLNMQKGASGASFAAWQSATDVNAQLNFWYYTEVNSDPYQLNGKTYGLMNWGGGVAGKAIMSNSVEGVENALEAKTLTVMSTADNKKQLYVPGEGEITMWTFEWTDNDNYLLKAAVNGSNKYLRIDENGLSMVSTPDDNCKIQVVPGTGIHAGEICLKCGNTTLTYNAVEENSGENGDEGDDKEIVRTFGVGGNTVGNEWLFLVDPKELTEEYLMTYSASKVSVSNPSVTNGSRIIVYTRYWNDQKRQYDFYAIGSDGVLVPVYENGDSIEWAGGQFNTLLWNFVEYYWEGTTDPNHYYELYNQYSEKYIAPQITDGQILSNGTIGINLNGRRDGKYSTPILAWDEEAYSYVGLKVENGRIVPCPKSEAMDFYFAVMQDLNVDDNLTLVPTVDHTQYGITMKMIDLENGKDHKGYMSQFLGNSDGGVGTTLHQELLSTDLGSDGYPTTKVSNNQTSLADLYNYNNGAQEVNHLFIESTYYSSGYFMYDSTQNFASLDGNNFKVYKELGSYDSGGNRPTLKHGQFFPYNDLIPGVFASVNKQNLYDLSDELDNTDPRKYENLYSIEHGNEKADTYFAMELEASFTQTPSGLDAWGHDIIFEFTGDDDFWLYVDGELVIDLGGIHSAVPGSVNFRTGEVNVNGNLTNLRELFASNYRKRNPNATDQEVKDYLRTKHFKEGENVFEDGTTHTMRIFYMERGAGASNLQMRFNLAAMKKGTVQLSKQLDGVDDPESVKAEFPYQIWYKDENGNEKRLTNALPHDSEQNDDYVFYKDSINPVKYIKELVVDGTTNEEGTFVSGIKYEDVFFLKPGETADINFPEAVNERYPNGVPYRIVGCGINTNVYDKVTVNENEITGTQDAGKLVDDGGTGYNANYGNHQNRKDFGIEYKTANERSKVNYVNKVDDDALRTITITKNLYKEDGETVLNYSDDGTLFTFRLYLASEYEGLDVANMHSYHVKDAEGYYCWWDRENQKFKRILNDSHEGISNYDDLSEDQKNDSSINFTTSIYGTIAKIPAGYTIEIRNVLAGTQYRVEERPWEIPDGYSFRNYEWNNKTKGNANLVTTSNGPGINGTVVSREDDPQDPYVKVYNLRGWGLRVNKVWSDADYMSTRDATYFAVYTGSSEDSLTLVPNTVRKLEYSAKPQTLYWYFLPLPVNVPFDQYEIREVIITGNPTVDSAGYVTNVDTLVINPIPHEGKMTISGTQRGESTSSDFEYTVLYNRGTVGEGSNVRVDTVTNNRPGIVLKKTEWNGSTPLPGATFTLKDAEDDLIGTFTSDEDGLITVAFLRDDVAYTLTETSTPQGWHGLQTPMTITLNNRHITVDGSTDSSYYIVNNETVTPTLTVKNRPYTFEAIKKDRDTNQPMAGVTFSLHKEKTVGGVTSIDLNAEAGYENLVTDRDGVIPEINNTLSPGTYELWETTPEGYQPISKNGRIRFKVSEMGAISLVGTQDQPIPDGVTLSNPVEQEDGSVAYKMTILNRRQTNINLRKEDDSGNSLKGSKFQLCKFTTTWEVVSDYENIDLTSTATAEIKNLTSGRYRLTETKAPDGYIILNSQVYFNVSFTEAGVKVTLTDGEGTGENANAQASTSQDSKTIIVKNTPGAELPETGGTTPIPLYVFGSVLLFGAACGLILKRKRR